MSLLTFAKEKGKVYSNRNHVLKKKRESWHNSCTAFPRCVNLQVTISAQFILCM